MCGFVGFTGQIKDKPAVLQRMLGRIAHRGPDSADTYLDDGLAVGFRRLSIIDLAGGGQPIYNEDRTKILVFNGEIYNYQGLREELITKGHIFTTQSDSEVLLHGYEEYGVDLLPKLRGMYAFAIWDNVAGKLFGARDSFGIKPFYYALIGETFFFGSEIKSFLPHPKFKKELFEEKLADYLTFSCVPGNETFFKNVYKLMPGHYLEYQNGQLNFKRYFRPEFKIEAGQSMDHFVDKITEVVDDSVLAHKISDVEVGCFLSSGVDSSYLAAKLAKQDNKLRTYTIGFKDLKYSEVPLAKDFAEAMGVENKVRLISAEEYFAKVGAVQYHLDEPLANPSANLLYFVSELAGADLKVVLSGEGADEMFGGYNVYKEPLALKPYQTLLPLFLRHFLAGLVERLPDFKGKNFIIRGSKTIEERYIGNSNIFSLEQKKKVLKKTYPLKSPQDWLAPVYAEARGWDDVTKMQYADIHFWMVQEILLKADKMSMAHSLELRVPFLDTEVFKLARTIPPEYKVSQKNTKLAFRLAAEQEMPKFRADRSKLAFPLPLVEWLREEKYYELVKSYFKNDVAKKFFNQDLIINYLNEHKAGERNNARKIWTIFSWLVWYEEFFVKVIE